MATTTTPSNDASSSRTCPKIVTLNEIETITNTPSFQKDLIDAIAKGFAAFHQGDFFAAPIQTLGVAVPFCCHHQGVENYAAQTCVKSGYFRNNPYYVIKVASGGYPLPTNSGLMQVYSQQTGRLVALLLDEGILTELRTAAVGALAFTLFAPRNTTCIGMVGTGVQARFQLQWLANVTTCRKVVVYGRSLEKAQTLKKELQESGWNVTLTSEADELLSQCDVIVTTTCARQPILGTSCNQEATGRRHRTKLITCIGADAPGKMELNPALVKDADALVADSLQQTRERGEFQTWCADNSKDSSSNEDKLFSLGQILAEKRSDLQRNKSNDEEDEHDNRLFIFDSSGVALQDCVIAQMVYEALSPPPSS